AAGISTACMVVPLVTGMAGGAGQVERRFRSDARVQYQVIPETPAHKCAVDRRSIMSRIAADSSDKAVLRSTSAVPQGPGLSCRARSVPIGVAPLAPEGPG